MKYTPPIGAASQTDPYVDGNPSTGTEGSAVPAAAIEAPQREIDHVITAAGLTPDHSDNTQLEQAISTMLGALSVLPVGAEIMWSKSTIPSGWLEQNGATFDAVTYPALYAHLGTNVLPDMRGEFVRGWDNGRGVDGGRALKSAQTDELKSHTHPFGTTYEFYSYTGTKNKVYATGSTLASISISEVPAAGGAETRPRNVAKMFLIKAA